MVTERDVLPDIVVTLDVSHFEISIVKVSAARNTTKKQKIKYRIRKKVELYLLIKEKAEKIPDT